MQRHGGNIWLAEQTYGIHKENILDFSANINPLGPSPRALEAVQKSLVNIKHYPEPQAESLRREIARLTSLPEEMIILGNGAAELIYALGKVIKPRRVLVPVPTFSEYAGGFADAELVQVVLHRENNFTIEPKALAGILQPGDLMILCNPNNPTGQLVERCKLHSLLKRAREVGAWFMVDEAFMDFVRPEQSLLPDLPANPSLLVLRSLTKFFAMPGLRLGYLAAAPEIISGLLAALPPWRVNLPAQVAGIASLQDREYIEKTFELMNSQRSFLTAGLAAIPGLKPFPPAANFILVGCSESGYTAAQIQNFLGPRGILIRQCDNFTGLDGNYFRTAVRCQEENSMLLHHLWQIIIKKKNERRKSGGS